MSDKNFTAEELVENASLFNFIPKDISFGKDENGEDYDHSFVTENGRVSWEKNNNGNYETLLSFFSEDKVNEKRELTSQQLTEWFYSPTNKHYEEVISLIELQS